MFSGQFSSPLTTKNQLTPPQGFGDLLTQGAMITRGFDRNLMVLTSQAFQKLSSHVMSMNLTDPNARMLMRMLLGNANEISIDKAGQLIIPDKLCRMANLQSPTVMVGMGDFFEIWSAEAWSEQELKLSDSESDPNRFSSLNLVMH
jgi:MraZ protein